MDLAVGAKHVYLAMEHTTRDGKPRLVERCTIPVTARGVVGLVVTNLGLFEITKNGFLLREIAPGISVETVKASTGGRLTVPDNLSTVPIR
jgi:3-oxoacid CoA-transferase B subunit